MYFNTFMWLVVLRQQEKNECLSIFILNVSDFFKLGNFNPQWLHMVKKKEKYKAHLRTHEASENKAPVFLLKYWKYLFLKAALIFVLCLE